MWRTPFAIGMLITIKRTGALIVLGICDIVWLWKATPWQTF